MVSEIAVCSLLRMYICCSEGLKETVTRRNLVVNKSLIVVAKQLTHFDIVA